MVAVLVIGGCRTPQADIPTDAARDRVAVSDGWLAMGTFFEAELRVQPGQVENARAYLAWAREELVRLEAIYSRHDAQSELSELNRSISGLSTLPGTFLVSRELEDGLRHALQTFTESGGAFDVTVGPLIDVWTRAAERSEWPKVEVLRDAKHRVGGDRLKLVGDGQIEVNQVGMRIDLDGIAKGLALDRLAERYSEHFSGQAALLSFGQSSVRAIGDPEGRRESGGWRLEAQSRDEQIGRLAVVRLRDRSLSVSSSVGRVTWIGDQRISHVVDPRTGTVVEGTVEAIVVADLAADADAWSTALLVLGARPDAMRRAERGGREAYVFESSGRISASEGWETIASD